MNDLDYSDFVTIKITRVSDETGPAYWEMDFMDKTGHEVASATGPRMHSVLDFAVELLQRDDWADFDANNRHAHAEIGTVTDVSDLEEPESACSCGCVASVGAVAEQAGYEQGKKDERQSIANWLETESQCPERGACADQRCRTVWAIIEKLEDMNDDQA